MSIDILLDYIYLYGYLIIFLFLFLGIVGVPAPEESLLFLVGVLVGENKLSLELAAFSAFLGAFLGMLAAFGLGKYIGSPFINRYGKYVGITMERWKKVRSKYRRNTHKTILFGFYMPGIRQVSPYFAGIAKIPFRSFCLLSLLGTVFWTFPLILAGLLAGNTFHLNPKYAPYFGVFFFIAFFGYTGIKLYRKKKQQPTDS
ncbi:MAG TPA: DedA family protein [Bacillus bacterium]|uniref:VTT domain-containing protein n=1 Tax=Siminovitchia fordii TaxID=254759 RepID=A0ABQ4K706_9BACI|nr:DedA family protein [Siminovitchia fordii]GIN21517.1 hypothetical protein J1TS3_26510 [Siminovitchia fordii]HBZ08893.1 DedA family protein [Bacillus sp. (in: firmicutes)]